MPNRVGRLVVIQAKDGGLLLWTERTNEETMEFQQLEMFAAVVEEGSVARAAQRVCRTAPAVSIAVKKLEDEMATPLFERDDRHQNQLTASGKLLYEHARRILDMRREAEAAVKYSTPEATLRIGTHESTSLYLLPGLMSSFSEAHPAIKTEVICGTADRLLVALANRTIELALIGDSPQDDKLESHLIKRDQLVVIARPNHRLSNRQHIRLEDLRDEYLIVQGSKSILRERIVHAMHKANVPFNFGVENVGIEAIKRMVMSGLGVGFVPAMCVNEEVLNGKLVPLKVNDLQTDWNISLVWRKDHSLSHFAREFVKVNVKKESTSRNAIVSSRRSTSAGSRKVAHC